MAVDRFQFFPGAIQISDVIISNGIDKSDITDWFKELNLESSVDTLAVNAQFVIDDAVNFLHSYRPNAGDDISIKISYADEVKHFSFKVLEIAGMADYQRQRSYILNCVSHFYYLGMYKEVAAAHTGTTSEIAKKIFNKHSYFEKSNIWEQSVGVEKLVVPKLSVNDTMRWLARKSTWAKDSVRMKFFQDSNLKYNFMPIEKSIEMYTNEPAFEYTYNLVASTIGPEQLPNSIDTYKAVKDLTYHENQFNIKTALESGRIAGTRFAPNIVTKKYRPVTYDYFDSFDKQKHLNPLPQFNKFNFEGGVNQFDINSSYTQNTPNDLNKVSDASNIKVSNIDLSQAVDIEVVGNQSVDVGQIIQLNISSPEPVSESRKGKLDTRYSGRYFVYNKRDVYSDRNTHKMALTLIKESQMSSVLWCIQVKWYGL